MSSPQRGPLGHARAFAWTVLLVAVLLWGAVWLISQIYIWLLILLAVSAVVAFTVWWLRARRDRW